MPLIKNAVGNAMKNDPEDMVRVKTALIDAGYLEEPELHGYITRSTDNAIRAFQLANNLKVDGILKPGAKRKQRCNGYRQCHGASLQSPSFR